MGEKGVLMFRPFRGEKNTLAAGAPTCPNMRKMQFRTFGKDTRSLTRAYTTRFVGCRHVLGYNGSCGAGRGSEFPLSTPSRGAVQV